MKDGLTVKNKSYGPLLGFLCLFNSAPLLAAEDELFFEMPIVLSANRLEQPISDAAVSISIIDRETIEASGARTIPEVLRLVPGMQVGFSGNQFGDEPKYVVTYHGHSDQYSKQMQVLIDGRSIYEPLLGGINWKSVPVNIDDIERIEVSRGPNPATYGSNSFMAAINIITRTAAEDQGSYVRTNVGNHDIADLTYRYGGSNGKLDYRITGSTLNDDGLDSANGNDYPDDTNSNNIDYRLDYQINNHNSLSYQGGYGENRQQTDRNHDAVLPTERTVENTRFFQFIKLESAINTENTLQLQYYYNLSDKEDRYESDLIDPGSPPDAFRLDLNDDVKTERHNLELTHIIYPDKDLKLVWGLSTQLDFVRAPLSLGVDEKVENHQNRIFANIEWHINQSNIINLGALAEKNDFSDTELSPRLSFTHAFNKQHKVRFGVSQAIRSPFIYEERANLVYSQELTLDGEPIGTTLVDQQILGNTELKNEKIISREIAYFGAFLNSTLLLNARLFHDDITDYIDTLREDADTDIDNVPDDLNDFGDPDAPNTVLVFQNPTYSTTNGLEIELNYHIDPTLRLIASGAVINISSNSNAIAHSAPQHSYSLFLTKRFNEKYNGSLGYYYVDEFKWTDARDIIENSDEVSTDDYQALDIRLSRNFNFSKTHGSLSLVLKNLLGDYSDYQKHQISSTAPVAVQNTVAYIDFRLNF